MLLLLVSIAPLACGRTPAVEPATMVLRGGKIVTVDAATPEAQAMAVRGDTIVALGTNDEIQAYVGPATQVIDLAGQLAVPGLIEGHGHFTGVGRARMSLRLMGVKNFEEIVSMVAEAATAAKPGDWIQGRGWHQEKWDHVPAPNVEGFPLHDALSKVSPNNPVVLTHASGHAIFANAKAMELAGVTRRTPNPSGGEILKDQAGNPIGVFRETAQGLISAALGAWQKSKTPDVIMADRRKEIDLAIDESVTKGITSFQDAGASFETIDLYKRYVTEGRMGVRLWVMVRQPNDVLREKLPSYKVVGMGDHRMTVAAIKVTADGALGSRGAWMLEPYADSPSSTGLATTPVEVMAETAKIAIENGVQLDVHAIGDRANREVLNIYEAAFRANPDKKDVRWRIEHAQHLNAADIPRFGQLGVIASMQGIHATSDAPYVLARLGPKRAEEGAYVWQKLMQSGAIVSNGTDTPVEAIDPIANFYATVTRKTADGTVFFGDQKMSRTEALKSYTYNAAYAAKEEAIKGSLAVGKLADVTVLSKDIMTVPEEELLSTQVTYTIVGGKVVYRK
ncbi:MAG: amidohydrolase [Acidobacteria bacterium RIFCSPLOWO2_12_FULL_67_14b]|nr:MAG: amidohydrolase [Acidobacteria bacterium RIFCSPLOWO2_12_FULL_67_14b]